MGTGSFTGLKHLQGGGDHSPPSSVRLQMGWS